MRASYVIPYTALYLDQTSDQYKLTIRDLPLELKPREKLQSHGPEALSIRELMAIVLNVGTPKEDVLEMANRIVRDYGEKSILSEKDPKKLSSSLNIPIVKACQIVAVGELGRRFYEKNNPGFATVRNAKEVYEYLQDMRNLTKEHLRGLYLNSHNRIIRDEVITIGTVDANMIHPREVFRPAIEVNAAAVILAHNHPSGIASASKEDIEITEQLVQAGKIMGIRVLDHVIITKDAFVSIIQTK